MKTSGILAIYLLLNTSNAVRNHLTLGGDGDVPPAQVAANGDVVVKGAVEDAAAAALAKNKVAASAFNENKATIEAKKADAAKAAVAANSNAKEQFDTNQAAKDQKA